MCQQTNNVFFLNYLISKQAWSLNDKSNEHIFTSPIPPTKVLYKVKSRMMSKEEWIKAKQQLKVLNIK